MQGAADQPDTNGSMWLYRDISDVAGWRQSKISKYTTQPETMIDSVTEKHPVPPTSIESCESEQIHIPGSIQSFGALIAFNTDYKITRVSENVATIWSMPLQTMLGSSIDQLFVKADLLKLKKTVEESRTPLMRLRTPSGAELFGVPRHLGDETYIDLLPESGDFDPVDAMRQFMAGCAGANTVETLCQAFADEFRRASGFDRVKIYRFDQNWNGEVIAEALKTGMASYKGMHFPESDIPKQARELYFRNRVRVIGDVNAPQIPIVQLKGLAPLDLSFSFLRSVSPIHLQYLRNMDVHASLSLSISVKGRFWGLIACHHASPRNFDSSEESFFRMVGDMCGYRLASTIQTQEAKFQAQTLEVLQQLAPRSKDGSAEELLQIGSPIRDLISSNSIVIAQNGTFSKCGSPPDDPTLTRLLSWLEQGDDSGIFYCDDLPSRFSESLIPYACGLVAVKVPNKNRCWVLWFRPEYIRDIHWAGDPYHPKKTVEFGDRLFPRTSFEIFSENRRGHSAPWAPSDLSAAKAVAGFLGKSKIVT